jgi:hypothetical protein
MKLSFATVGSLAALALCAVPFLGCNGTVETDGSETAADEIQAGDDCTEAWGTTPCVADDGSDSIRTCIEDTDGTLTWGACESDSSSNSTPLVIAFSGERVTFAASSAPFDINGRSTVATDWPTASTPWLALDRNGNGAIDDGSELFGSASILSSGEHASNGFQSLAELDLDGDGTLTAADPGFSSLVLWADANADRLSTPDELVPAASRGIVAIELGYQKNALCDARRNCEVERASVRVQSASGGEHVGAVIDVHLAHQ